MYLYEVFVLQFFSFLGCLGVPTDISSDVVNTFPTGGVSSPMEEVLCGRIIFTHSSNKTLELNTTTMY